ncbi:hypothetical protein ACFQWB_03455 [Paenibacillus thermoaerophilus]|uniref:Lipase (Class 3) n=1 Tax=Paenibacillus thermoaerophilus TaxID=1215385 RepID=A0ABW2V0G7_9BACL|nr:hypothetical protein [Paenibacillus thermoaerophilus]TMV10434.1 hypothetical protein FE781_14045 [Paenibacillus thermoaerophilus]
MTNGKRAGDWDVYLIAGVRSYPGLFRGCIAELERRFGEMGLAPAIRELFPYGDHTAPIVRQLLEVQGDWFAFGEAARAGTRIVAEYVRSWSRGRKAMLVGHSGGGVAAYRAAARLAGEGAIADFRVVQIGSPKVPIHAEHRSRVRAIAAVDERGRCTDPVARLGSWGGLRRGRYGLRLWDRLKHAPGEREGIPVIGGHAYYFRSDAPYVHPERGSNLSLTVDAIWKSAESIFRLA